MKKHFIAIICAATLTSTNLFGQFANTPTQNTPDQSTGGKVGIGTGAPAGKLDVLSTSNQLRLSNTATIFSDINTSSAGHLIFQPGTTTGKIAFGISVPASGVGFHSNMGLFRISDNLSATRAFQVTPNHPGSGDMPAGVVLLSAINTGNEGLSLVSSGGGTAGVKLGAYAFNGSWKSVWETANTTGSLPNLLLVKNGGNVGIGTGAAAPREKLEVLGNARFGAAGAGYAVDPNTVLAIYQNVQNATGIKVTASTNAFEVWDQVANVRNFLVKNTGYVYAREINVMPTNIAFPDYVFANDYKLMSLTEVEKYVIINKHLPNIPSANEVKADGINLAELQIKQMEKIEELYLHLIELKKENDTLKTRIESLEKK